MAFSTQLEALKVACSTFRDVGLHKVHMPMPEEMLGPDLCPFITIDPDNFAALSSNVTVFTLPVVVNWFHEGIPDDIEYQVPPEMWDIPQELFRHLAASATLQDTTYAMTFGEPAGYAGTLSWHAQHYAGATVSLRLKEKENTTWA